MNVVAEEPLPTDSSISDCQRKCLSHIFRNLLESLAAALTLVERSDTLIPKDLLTCVKNPEKMITRIKDALEKDSFCVLDQSECSWVGKFCGCDTMHINDVHINDVHINDVHIAPSVTEKLTQNE